MKNSKLRRALLLLACAVMLVCLSVGATLAYLTGTTNVVENTFTVGNVTFDPDPETDLAEGLTEAKVNEYGEPVDNEGKPTTWEEAPRVESNTYKLLPGHTYLKDPTVVVTKGSEVAYIRMIVTVSNSDLALLKAAFPKFINDDGSFNLAALVDGWVPATWTFDNFKVKGDNGEYEFRYYTTVDARTVAQKLEPLFTHVVIPGDIDNDTLATLKDVKINVVAHAIQADGFNGSADAAWTAFDGQVAGN